MRLDTLSMMSTLEKISPILKPEMGIQHLENIGLHCLMAGSKLLPTLQMITVTMLM